MKKLNFDLRRLSDPDLAARTGTIIDMLTANFATAPLLPGLIGDRDAYLVALAASLQGSKVDKAVKNQSKEDLLKKHFQVINYLNMICNGNPVELSKTGYSVSRSAGSSPEVTVPINLVLTNGMNSGEQELSFDPVPGAKSYSYEYTADPLTADSQWTVFTGTKRKFLFTSLEPGKRYWIRVAAIGINGQRVYSDPILSRIVQ